MFQCKSCPFSCINVVIARSEEQLHLKDEIKINVTDQSLTCCIGSCLKYCIAVSTAESNFDIETLLGVIPNVRLTSIRQTQSFLCLKQEEDEY